MLRDPLIGHALWERGGCEVPAARVGRFVAQACQVDPDLIVVGIAGVVAVLIPVLAMYVGFRSTIRGDGRPDRAIVLSHAAMTEYDSGLPRDSVAVIADTVGVWHDARGDPLVSAEVVLAAPVARKRDRTDVNVTLRGVGVQYFAVRPELKLVAGRMFRPGNQELLVGAAARSQFQGLEIGDQVRLQDGDWKVVGVFAGEPGARGSRESELIADARTVMSAYKLDSFNSMTVQLDSAAALPMFQAALAGDARLFVSSHAEPEYLASASGSVNRMLCLVAYAIGSIMALGALFAALNSMYSAVTARAVETATLRAMGFAASAVAVALLTEALLLALAGAVIGVAIAYAAVDGATISTLGGALFDSQVVYSLRLSPGLVASAIALAATLGLAGGLLPAIRAARGNIAAALHEN